MRFRLGGVELVALEPLKSSLKEHEGVVPFLYLDTKGNPTVGVGHLLPTQEIACALPWERSLHPVDPRDVEQEFMRVLAMEKGKPASYYGARTVLRLSPETIDALLDADIAAKFAELEAAIFGFAAYPECVQCAMLDIAFNCGVAGLLHGFPKLMEHVKRADWEGAAQESRRPEVSPERNEWTAQMFREALAPVGVRT